MFFYKMSQFLYLNNILQFFEFQMLDSVFSFLFGSFFTSSSSAPTLSSLNLFLNKKKIASCSIAISKESMNIFNKNSSHASLLLIYTDSNVDNDNRGDGILIEYGNYFPSMSKKEAEEVTKKNVIYRYGDNGGLRYYAINYKEYLKHFGDICYVSMDISSDNQMTFLDFIDRIAPISEEIWTKEKYKAYSFLNGDDVYNSQTF